MTSPLKKTAGNACPTALLLRVHHRACALLVLILDSVSWHQCDTFSSVTGQRCLLCGCHWLSCRQTRRPQAYAFGLNDCCSDPPVPLCRHCRGQGTGGALWKSHCHLLGTGDPVSKSHGNLSFLECCCEPSSELQADTILHMEFHQPVELHSVVHIFQIDRHGQNLFLPLKSFVDIACECGCVSQVVFPALYPPWF